MWAAFFTALIKSLLDWGTAQAERPNTAITAVPDVAVNDEFDKEVNADIASGKAPPA